MNLSFGATSAMYFVGANRAVWPALERGEKQGQGKRTILSDVPPKFNYQHC
jgi:hypothetical protein